MLSGGFGSGVLRLLQESGFSGIQIKNIGIPDKFIEHGTQGLLRKKYGLDAEGIVKQTLELFPEYSPKPAPKLPNEAKTTG